MEIIPVIDIRRGQVVHAVKGQRQNYCPLQTSLCESNSPEDIVQAFISSYPFKTIYIADLDAIEGQSNNDQIIEQLHDKFQSLTFWVDQGISSTIELKDPLLRQHVIGSETNISPDILNEIIISSPDIILSLDFQSNTFLGVRNLLQKTSLWPGRIIIMSLARVGSDNGPDYELISSLKKTAGDRKIYVAGGVRHETDLNLLNDMGIDGVLLATALHTERITSEILKKFTKKNAP
ncbi:MAG: nickel transporter [Proteobacteria bacterium]|nr:nickel transporter [Pseudomonadota bacterium]